MNPLSTIRLPYHGDRDAVLAALVRDASAIPGYVALCLISVNGHGYGFEDLTLQLQDGHFLRQGWDDLSNEVSEPSLIKQDFDLHDELQHLRTDGTFLRQRQSLRWHIPGANYPADQPINRNPDLKTGCIGRLSTIYLAVGEDTEWVVYPRPLSGGHYRNTAANRIFRALLYGDSVTLE